MSEYKIQFNVHGAGSSSFTGHTNVTFIDNSNSLAVEAFIQTGGRSALSYFIKPLRDQIAHALKES
ncbi:hypothetical protein [Polycladidibacter stylochi]|uniref:hypothetical protein n=1 Tax=Polycladidibacter stylochi TaxID=1807766 RepID=UPI000835E591|nr:hypothetical protein [Pseudovibrio stylochi]